VPVPPESNAALSRAFVMLVMGVLVVAAALSTVLTARLVFPHGSGDLDEVAYQAQANTLSVGHATLPARTHDPVFMPFLSGVRGDRVVFKYQPVWPAFIAVSDKLFGTSLPARVLLSIAGVLAVVWLASELLRDQRIALIAGAIAVVSPFTWVQSASLLGYQLSFVLGAAAAAALLRAQRTANVVAGLGAGALAGLAVLHRPFDAVLLVTPMLAYCLWQSWRARTILRLVALIAAGAAPLLIVFGAYNWSVMGSPLRSPFGITGSIDSFGFGWRASFEVPNTGHAGQIHYTVGLALSTLRHFFAVLPRFVAFAPAALICFGLVIFRRWRDARLWLLVAMMLTVIVGYLFWWGTADAFHFGLERELGPYYEYPILAALCVAVAWGFMLLRSVTARVVLVLVGVLWTSVVSTVIMRDASEAGSARANELAQLDGTGRRLVFAAPLFPNDPYLRVANDARLRGPLVVGIAIDGHRLATIDMVPGRTVYEIRHYRRWDDFLGRQVVDRIELRVVRTPQVAIVVDAAAQDNRPATTYLRIGSGAPQFGAQSIGEVRARFNLDGSMLPSDGSIVQVAAGVTLAAPGAPPPTAITGNWSECRFEARRARDGRVEALTPCAGWHHYTFPGGRTATSREELGGHLDVTIRAAR